MTHVSIVIPTYNKASLVRHILDDLNRQSYKDFEVIVVDDGSTDDTLEQLVTVPITYPFRVYETGLVNQFGMCKAYNLGIAHARGPITLLLNDDIYLHPTCVEQHMNAHKRIRSKHALIGPRFKCPPYKVGELVESHVLRRREMKKYTTGATARGGSGFKVYRRKMMVSSNVSISTRRLRKIGGYNEWFKRYCGEIDREFYDRLKNARMEVLFLWRAQAYSVRYWYDLYKQTKWLKDFEGTEITVEQWKKSQAAKSRRTRRQSKRHPPVEIKHKNESPVIDR